MVDWFLEKKNTKEKEEVVGMMNGSKSRGLGVGKLKKVEGNENEYKPPVEVLSIVYIAF